MQRLSAGNTAAQRKASFIMMPVLAAGLMLSCQKDRAQKPEPGAEPAETAEISGAPIKVPERADSAYKIGFTTGCPEYMVRIHGEPKNYCIDRFEAHLVENRGGQDVVHPTSVPPTPLGRYVARSLPGVLPQSSVNRTMAENACMNAGKRLCTLTEWIRACAGIETYTYPYGNRETPKICNTRKPHILSALHGANPKGWGANDAMNDPLMNMVSGYLAKAGEYAGCMSSYGVYDMVGNVQEWVSTPVDERIIGSRPRLGPNKTPHFRASEGNGIFMGGFYGTANENGNGCHYMTTVHGPDQKDYSIGFRCCVDAQPI